MPGRPKILVVEDEPSICDNIQYALESEGMDVVCHTTGMAALDRLAHGFSPDLVVLDIGLPDMNGFEICKELRGSTAIPIVFLTARSSEIDRVVGFEIGGDDYVVKPFSPRELAARVKAILRRTQSPHEPTPETVASGFDVDEQRYMIRYHGHPLDLGRYEFRLLKMLLKSPGRVFTRAQLMDGAWEEPEASMERTVDTHIKSIRAKLRHAHVGDDPIRTHRGIGYSLELPG